MIDKCIELELMEEHEDGRLYITKKCDALGICIWGKSWFAEKTSTTKMLEKWAKWRYDDR